MVPAAVPGNGPPATGGVLPAAPAVRVVIAGGGTGGHAFPALALAEALTHGRSAAGSHRGAPAGEEPATTAGAHGAGDAGAGSTASRPAAPAAVRLAGTRRGPEARAAAAAGIPFDPLDVTGFRRSLAPRALAHNAAAAAQACRATIRAAGLLRRWRADVAVGTGGYASVPVALAAALTRTPLVIQEQNAIPGRANRLAGRWAAAVAVSFPGSERYFRGDRPVRATGNPVRPELARLDREALRPEALAAFGLEAGRRTLLVFGGSQGARRINAAAFGAYPAWRADPTLQVLHLVGPKELPAAQAQLALLLPEVAEPAAGDRVLWRLIGFTDRMDLAYAVADLAVCRAGASALFELAAARLPAIVVPYPHAGDHQRHNAQPLVDSEAITLVLDHDCTPERLVAAVADLMDDPGRRAAMSRALAAFARPEAAAAIADLVREVARR
jgi:UDP-N-acetylglucosamine--N-acetylmuramyl-(pentapeptide) pyrophosphoryl-undecaprenol N-acetylglucosamine transferase